MTKIVIVGDIIVSPELMKDAAEKIHTKDQKIFKTFMWETKDREDFQRKALNIEKNGPEAEDIPNGLTVEIEDADILLVHFCPVPKKLIEKAEHLKLIGTCRGGMEHIDVAAATAAGIPVIHCIRNAEATSDFAIGLMIAETRNIARGFYSIKENQWKTEYVNSTYTTTLNEMTLGIIGLGHIGKLVAKKAIGLGMKVIAYDPYVDQKDLDEVQLAVILKQDEKDVFRNSNVISLHLRATPETKNSINKSLISLMKPNAYLINTSRAQVLNKKDLLDALQKKTIGGAGLDVFWDEPIHEDDPLLDLENVTLTPHLAGNVVDALPKSPKLLVNNINEYFDSGIMNMIVNAKSLQ